MREIYFVTERQVDDSCDDLSLNGNKTIRVYTIVEGKPKSFFSIEVGNDDDCIEEIQNYLNDNGYGDNLYKFIEL